MKNMMKNQMKKTIMLIAFVFTFTTAAAVGNVQARDHKGDTKDMNQQQNWTEQQRLNQNDRNPTAQNRDHRSDMALRASSLLDRELMSRTGEELGKVSDIIINRKGEISYLIVSHGGWLGMGNDLVPIPWHAVNVVRQGEESRLVANFNRKDLEKAPTLSENDLENLNSESWQRELRGYYNSMKQGAKQGYQKIKEKTQEGYQDLKREFKQE